MDEEVKAKSRGENKEVQRPQDDQEEQHRVLASPSPPPFLAAGLFLNFECFICLLNW